MTTRFLKELADIAYLQPHHIKAANWIAEQGSMSREMAAFEGACRDVVLLSQQPLNFDLFKLVRGVCVSHETFNTDEKTLGAFRETLNAAYRLKQKYERRVLT